jgi:predicted PurR-regulated permease PerM
MIDRSHLQQLFLLVLAAGALAICYVIAEPFIGPIVSAGALAILFYPVHAALLRRMPGRPSIASALSLLLVIALIVIPSVWIVSAMTREVGSAYTALKNRSDADGGWVEWITHAGARPLIYYGVDPIDAEERVRVFLTERIEVVSASLLRGIQSVVSNVALFLFHSVIVLFVLFFLLRDGRRLLRRAREMLPLDQDVFDRLIGEVGQSVLANLYGVGAVALVQGAMTGLLFFFLGLPSPVVWGVVAGFCSMIPLVGPPIVWVPVAISLALTGSLGKAAIVVAVGAGVIGTADNVLRPWIVSGRIQVHPILVFISLLGGAQAFGFLGLFIGPAALSATIVILEVLRQGMATRVRRQEPVPPQDPIAS